MPHYIKHISQQQTQMMLKLGAHSMCRACKAPPMITNRLAVALQVMQIMDDIITKDKKLENQLFCV